MSTVLMKKLLPELARLISDRNVPEQTSSALRHPLPAPVWLICTAGLCALPDADVAPCELREHGWAQCGDNANQI